MRWFLFFFFLFILSNLKPWISENFVVKFIMSNVGVEIQRWTNSNIGWKPSNFWLILRNHLFKHFRKILITWILITWFLGKNQPIIFDSKNLDKTLYFVYYYYDSEINLDEKLECQSTVNLFEHKERKKEKKI